MTGEELMKFDSENVRTKKDALIALARFENKLADIIEEARRLEEESKSITAAIKRENVKRLDRQKTIARTRKTLDIMLQRGLGARAALQAIAGVKKVTGSKLEKLADKHEHVAAMVEAS